MSGWDPRGLRLARAWLVMGMLLVMTAACSGPSYELQPGQDRQYIHDLTPEQRARMRQTILESLQKSAETQRLRVGDTIEVIYHVRPHPLASRYRLAVGDKLSVSFGDDQSQNFSANVQPDGWIELPDTDGIRVAGQTVDEVNRAVKRQYADILVDPRVLVRLEDWTSDAERLAEDIHSFSLGRARKAKVLRDGTVTLPFLRPVMVQGDTIAEIKDKLQTAYQALGLDLEISTILSESAGDRVFVFGAVNSPGVLTPERPITTLMAVAQSGGPNDDGSLSDVRVFYTDGDGLPHLRKVNLHNVLMSLALEEDLVLPDNAVVYVPTTVLAQTGKFLDLVLNQILFYRGFSLSASYEMFGSND